MKDSSLRIRLGFGESRRHIVGLRVRLTKSFCAPEDSMSKFCTLCMDLRKSDIICDLHHDYAKLPESCEVCPSMAQR